MVAQREDLTGPDLAAGVSISEIPDHGMLLGHARGEAVLLVRRGNRVDAVGALCSHYGAPLAEGLVVDDGIRCPWHHACFDLRSGEAVRPPALNAIASWIVENDGDRVIVARRFEPEMRTSRSGPSEVVIVGAGASGNSAAETLRREGYRGRILLFGAEPSVPVDRPNLSKDYLAGNAPEEWLPLRDRSFYADQKIELFLEARIGEVDTRAKEVALQTGQRHPYGALILATGAEPVRLTIPGAGQPHVFTLRSVEDSRRVVARMASAKCAVVVGASFLGLEVAASLRTRGLEVHVVAPGARPLERVLGPELGDFVRSIHEEHGVTFHLGHRPRSIEERTVTLDDGAVIEADLVVAAVGVRPSTDLAERAGCRMDRGVVVDAFLETSVPGIFAAGDIARWVDPNTRRSIRVEHWVVAQRQGQVAARNVLGKKERFSAVPFFWSQHYDVPIAYVGYAEAWDQIEVSGSVSDRSCLVAYRFEGRIIAIASIFRDKENLEAEAAFEKGDQRTLEALMKHV